MESALTLDNVSKNYMMGGAAVHALREVSLTVEPASFVGITGPSGCGKSTLLNIAGLTERPDSGAVTLHGVPVDFTDERRLSDLRRTAIGYIFQYFNLLPTLTVTENILLPLLLNGERPGAGEERVRELLSEVGLSARASHLPHQLSGGEMQRVAICRAVAHRPRLVLADEPTGNLDSRSGTAVLSLLAELKGHGIAVLMASHSDRALARCDSVAELADGARVR